MPGEDENMRESRSNYKSIYVKLLEKTKRRLHHHHYYRRRRYCRRHRH